MSHVSVFLVSKTFVEIGDYIYLARNFFRVNLNYIILVSIFQLRRRIIIIIILNISYYHSLLICLSKHNTALSKRTYITLTSFTTNFIPYPEWSLVFYRIKSIIFNKIIYCGASSLINNLILYSEYFGIFI